jgi:hypothetical protein
MHGFLDIIPMFVEFAELLAGAGINVTGWLAKMLGADEKGVDEFIADLFGAYQKYTGMGTGKGLSGAMFGGLDAVFGKFDKDTTIQGSHFATKGTDKERTIGDWGGLGKRADKIGGWGAMKESWGSLFDLRTVGGDSTVAQMEKLANDPLLAEKKRQESKVMMKSADKWLIDNVPGLKQYADATIAVREWQQDLKQTLKDMMIANANQPALAPATVVTDYHKVTSLAMPIPYDPSQELKEIAGK